MKTGSSELLDDLLKRTEAVEAAALALTRLTEETLLYRPTSARWNILENIEHLNRYADFYLPAIKSSIESSTKPPSGTYRSYLLGNYFAESMPPRQKLNKMKTFKSKDPIGANISRQVIAHFLEDQRQLLQLLVQARKVNLMKNRTPTTMATWLTIMLGDTLRVVVYHNERHIKQIEELVNMQQLQ